MRPRDCNSGENGCAQKFDSIFPPFGVLPRPTDHPRSSMKLPEKMRRQMNFKSRANTSSFHHTAALREKFSWALNISLAILSSSSGTRAVSRFRRGRGFISFPRSSCEWGLAASLLPPRKYIRFVVWNWRQLHTERVIQVCNPWSNISQQRKSQNVL